MSIKYSKGMHGWHSDHNFPILPDGTMQNTHQVQQQMMFTHIGQRPTNFLLVVVQKDVYQLNDIKMYLDKFRDIVNSCCSEFNIP